MSELHEHTLEPLYRLARPYPRPATRDRYGVDVIAAECTGCGRLSWVSVEVFD